MRILFDQGTPVPLRRHLPNHSVTTAFELGWATLENGELLAKAEAENFDVMVTTDQNLKYQQDLSERRIAIVGLSDTSWPKIQAVAPAIAAAVDSARPNDNIEILVPANR